MNICHPNTPTLISQRDSLLKKTMRPDPLPYDIADEYPIVLNSKNSSFSHCMMESNKIVAHANLWPRELQLQQKRIGIGLIGNVASHPDYRGQGHIKTLITHLTTEAKRQQLAALILWSDLTQFYQKLGFSSVGNEYRITINADAIKNFSQASRQFLPTKPEDLTSKELNQMLQLRQTNSTNTLHRSCEEFATLLTTPDCKLLCQYDKAEVTGFAIIGKGYDMVAVIHEWGLSGINDIKQAVYDCRELLDSPSITLLSPGVVDEKWLEEFTRASAIIERHPMALANIIESSLIDKESLDQCFIWGLDSI